MGGATQSDCVEPPEEYRPTMFPNSEALLPTPCFHGYDNSESDAEEFRYSIARFSRRRDLDVRDKVRRVEDYAETHRKRRRWVIEALAKIDWEETKRYVLAHQKGLTTDEWAAVCRILHGVRPERWYWQPKNQRKRPSTLVTVVYQHAVSSHDSDLSSCAIDALDYFGPNEEQALWLSKRLPTEEDTSDRERIYGALTWLDDRRTNEVLRDLLRSGREPEVVRGLIVIPRSEGLLKGELLRRSRYDFLPELRAFASQLRSYCSRNRGRRPVAERVDSGRGGRSSMQSREWRSPVCLDAARLSVATGAVSRWDRPRRQLGRGLSRRLREPGGGGHRGAPMGGNPRAFERAQRGA